MNFIIIDEEDYRVTSTTVNVAAEKMPKSFTINIINDNITECDETFKLTLNVPTLTCGAVNGDTDTTEVTIKDDDGGRSVSDYVVLFIY